MPFEAKTYFRLELKSAVSTIAGGNPKRIDNIWEKIETMFNGVNRQKAAEKEVRKFLTVLSTGGVNYKQFFCIADYYNNSNYSYLQITSANLAAAKALAALNEGGSTQIENFYKSMCSNKPIHHRAGKNFANWVVPLNA